MTDALELVKRRYSCRRYLDRPLAEPDRKTIGDFLASLVQGPFGNKCRFALIAATPEDSEALKGLGTYGFIRGAAGFIVGAVRPAPKDMEDYGYCLERVVLKATDINVGTCWLGRQLHQELLRRQDRRWRRRGSTRRHLPRIPQEEQREPLDPA